LPRVGRYPGRQPGPRPHDGRRTRLERHRVACLEKLWTAESGWKHRADNPTSSAYGIPQSLPGSKMAAAGSDWRTNPTTQITWGLDYITDRYGTPCAAWTFWNS